MRTCLHSSTAQLKQRGFSMLEILITLVIIATALLGTAGLQINAIRMNQSSQFRTQAVFLASDIAERMEANKVAAIAGNYVVAQTSTPSTATDCSTGSCDSTTLAAWDISQWENAIITLGLPQASWEVTQTGTGDPSTYKIVINWTDRSSDKSTHGENFSYTATRTVNN
jgi:type IV pilus assembly protein PilV